MSEQIAQKLEEAMALIEKGWCQYTYSRDGCVCAMGAIATAIGGQPHMLTVRGFDEAYGFVSKAIGNQLVGMWNDTKGRAQAEVIEAFRKAAELARQEQVA